MQVTWLIVCLAGQFMLANCYCPNGWTRYDNSCYLFMEKKDTWHKAKQKCFDLDGHLARVENDKEKNFLEQYLVAHHQYDAPLKYNYWIDGNDMTIDGDWLWEHNQSITYFDWAPGEPNGHSGQNCMCLYGQWHFKMDDNRCGASFGFICELSDPVYEPQGGNIVG